MSLDPRLAQGIIQAVDTRFAQLRRAEARTAYGVVAGASGGKASVYVSGETTPSLGFTYSERNIPEVGDQVQVVIDPHGDRYISHVYSANQVAAAMQSPFIRVPSTADVSQSSTNHPFQIGPDGGQNLRIDNNEVMAVYNGAAARLYLNREGGRVVAAHGIESAGLSVPSEGSLWGVQWYDTASNVVVGGSDTEVDSGFRVTYPGIANMTGKRVIIHTWVAIASSWGSVNAEHNYSLYASRAPSSGTTRLLYTRHEARVAGQMDFQTFGVTRRYSDAQTSVQFRILVRRTSPTTGSNWTPYAHASDEHTSQIGFFVVGFAD